MTGRKGGAGRNAQLTRILLVVGDLSRVDGIDIYELAQRRGTTPRTIRRDLEALEEAGFELVAERDAAGKRQRWRIVWDRQPRRLESLVDVSHYLALRMAMGQRAPLHQKSTTFAHLEDLADKIEEALGPRQRKQLESIDRCLYSYDKFAYRDAAPDMLWPLLRAIEGRNLCHIKYGAAGAGSSFRALPLRLFVHDRAVYLHAYVPFHDNVIVLNLHRLWALEVLDKKCAPPKSYDPASYETAAFGVFVGGAPVRYRVRFGADVAHYIRERTWHPSQELRELPGRGVELSFSCSPSHEVEAWIGSWRDAAEVIEPVSLRRRMAAVARRLVKTYARRPPT